MEVVLKITILVTYLLNMNKDCSQNYKYIFLTNNIVERLKVSLIELLFYNLMYVSNIQNADSDDLPFDGDQRFITRL